MPRGDKDADKNILWPFHYGTLRKAGVSAELCPGPFAFTSMSAASQLDKHVFTCIVYTVPLAAGGSVRSLEADCCKHVTRLSTIHDHALR